MRERNSILNILPYAYQQALDRLELEQAEEIRLRLGRPPTLLYGGAEHPVAIRTGMGLVSQQDLEQVLQCATSHSSYAVQEQIKQGYLSLPGGHRIGLCGRLIHRDGQAVSMKEISSLNIRLAHDHWKNLKHRLPQLKHATLIIGPPGSGKTTLLRALIRKLSDENIRVGVVDERAELAACLEGHAQFDLGMHTDIITGCRKSDAIMMLLRSMNPQWIAVDEITTQEDLATMEHASYCGVHFLATAHAFDRSELYARPLYRRVIELNVFQDVLILRSDKTFVMEKVKQC